MPQGISDFSRVASNLPDATPLRAEQNTVTQATYKRGVTRAENMQANTETAKAFLNAVRSHPGFARGGEEIAARLNTKIEKGLPLCADEVRTVVRQLNGEHARLAGERLEQAGILPEGTSAAFAKHALTTFGSLEGEHALRASVRDFLISHVIPGNAEKLTNLDSALAGHNGPPLSADEKKQIQDVLVAYRGESDAESYLKTLLVKNIAAGLVPNAPVHPEFGKGLAGLAGIGISNLFAQANREEISLLAALPADTRSTVLKNVDLLHTLMDNQHNLSPDELVGLVRYVSSNQLPLTSNAERGTVLRDFLLTQAGLHMQDPLPLGLPAQLSRPLVFNPEVRRNATVMLQASLGPSVVPTHAQVHDALLQARDRFATAHAPQLNEFLNMAMDPPAGLTTDPPLTPQTLPRYLNTLLSGDAVLEPLFNDSRPVDVDFLHNALLYNLNMEATGDVVGSAMGIDDANTLHEGTMKLLMARRGVGEAEYPAMMERGIARFGRVISELNTLSETSFTQGNDAAQRDVLSLRRVLSGTLVNMAEHLTPANRAALSLPADTKEMMGVLLDPFNASVDVRELSAQMHDFGTSMGIELPPADNAVAMNAMEQQLHEANDKIVDSTLARILGDGTQGGAVSVPFQEMVNDLIAELHLTDITAANLKPQVFFENAARSLHKAAENASAQNTTLDAGTLRNELRQSMAADLTGIHSLLAQIDALPKPSNLSEEQHTEQKRIMKDMLHMHPIADAGVLSRLMKRAAATNETMEQLRAPLATPVALATTVSTLVRDYSDITGDMENKALPCFLEMIMRTNKLDAAGAAQVHSALTGEAGSSIAASCKFILDSPQFTPQQKAMPRLIHDTLSRLATLYTGPAEGKAEQGPAPVAKTITHISEIPAGCVTLIVPSNTPLQSQLNRVGQRLTPAEWNMLERTGNALSQNMTRDQDKLAGFLASNASSILNAARASGNPASLTMDQVATAVLGSRLTSTEKKNGTTDGNRLYNAYVSRYAKEVGRHIKNANAAGIDKVLRMGMANGFSFPVLKSLASPAGKITLPDLPPGLLELGSLGSYTTENAFGLQQDFPRLHGASITLSDAGGTKQSYSPSVFPAGDRNIPADNPVFQSIITNVGDLSSSEVQKLRVMQLFTQAGRRCAGMSAQVFPSGAEKAGPVPPMNYSVARTANADIVVTMTSLKDNPLNIEQEILVDKNGGYKTTKFLMERRSVAQNNPAHPAQA